MDSVSLAIDAELTSARGEICDRMA